MVAHVNQDIRFPLSGIYRSTRTLIYRSLFADAGEKIHSIVPLFVNSKDLGDKSIINQGYGDKEKSSLSHDKLSVNGGDVAIVFISLFIGCLCSANSQLKYKAGPQRSSK